MVKYFEEIEKQQGVQKKQVAQNKFLYFIPEGEKYSFCSSDKQLQEWCENVKNKRVKRNAIKFVVEGAKKSLDLSSEKNRPQLSINKPSQTSKKIDPNTINGWDTNIAQAFNLYCQKSGIKPPEFKTTGVSQEKGGQVVGVSMIMEDGTIFNGSGRDKQDAKRDVLEQYATDVLGVDIKKDEYNSNDEEFGKDDELYIHHNHETGETYWTYNTHDKEEQESLKRLQEKEKLEEEKTQKLTDLKIKSKQQRFDNIDKRVASAQVKKLNSGNGRKYEISLLDGTKYNLDISYKDEVKRKAQYANDCDYRDEMEPIRYKETDVKSLTIKCDKIIDGKTDSFSMQSSIPQTHVTKPYALDLMMLSNLKMTSKNSEKPEVAENAHLLTKLLEVTNDLIHRAPKLLKQSQNQGKSSIPSKER